MDQARCWMWTNYRRPVGLSSSNLQGSTKPSYDDSWEEQAFAEDASGALGGCVWPPRSYSCSFCGREFASAQALGGHMNVHRRDRARLKQSPTSQDETLHHHDHQNQFSPMGSRYQPDEVCNFVYNPNPNSIHATPSSKENFPEPSLVRPVSSTPKSWSNFVAADRYYHFSDLWNEGEKTGPEILESGCSVKADLSVCLNLIVKEEIGCKRKRSDHTALLPFFVKPISIEFERLHVRPAEVSDDHDIDLELRLGLGKVV